MTEGEALKQAKHFMHIVYCHWYPKFMCSIVAWMLIGMVKPLGIHGRFVALTRPSCDPLEGHSICELKFGNKWIAFDVSYDYCVDMSAKEMAESEKALTGHPIYKERYDEFKELYQNREYIYDCNTGPNTLREL